MKASAATTSAVPHSARLLHYYKRLDTVQMRKTGIAEKGRTEDPEDHKDAIAFGIVFLKLSEELSHKGCIARTWEYREA